LLIGIAGIIELLVAFLRLADQRNALEDFRKQIKSIQKNSRRTSQPLPEGAPDGEEAFSDQSQAAIQTGIWEIAAKMQESHLLRRRVEMVRWLFAKGAQVEPPALAALSVAELDRVASWARWALSSVVLFGLGGTLVGLSIALPAVGGLNSDQAQFYNAVRNMIPGLKTAFSTTLMGIFWAIVLGLVLSRLRRSQGAYLQKLEEVSATRIYPFFTTSPATAIVQAAQHLAGLEAQLGTSLRRIIDGLEIEGQQLRTAVAGLVIKTEEVGRALVGETTAQGNTLKKALEKSLGGLVEKTEGVGSSLKKEIEGLVQETKDRGIALANTVDRSMGDVVADLKSGTGELIGGMNALVARFDETHRAVHALIGEPAVDALTLAQNVAMMQEGVQFMKRAAERMLQMAPSIEDILVRQLDRQGRTLQETMEASTKRLGAVVERQEAAVDHGFQHLDQGLSSFGGSLLDQLRRHEMQLLAQIQEKAAQVGTAVEHQSVLVGQGVERLEQSLAGFESVLNDYLERHSQQLLGSVAAPLGEVRALLQEQQEVAARLRDLASAMRGSVPGAVPPILAPDLSLGAGQLVAKLGELGVDLDRVRTALDGLPPRLDEVLRLRGNSAVASPRLDVTAVRGDVPAGSRSAVGEDSGTSVARRPSTPSVKRGFLSRLFGGS